MDPALQKFLWDFFWRIVNFVILAGIAVYFFRKYDVLEKVLGGYGRKIQGEIDSAAQLHREAEQIKRDIEKSAVEADARAVEMVEKAKHQAERERAAITERAQAEAERILAQARKMAEYESERQLLLLQQDVVDLTLERTRREVAAQITKKDHDRLVNEFLDALTTESLRVS